MCLNTYEFLNVSDDMSNLSCCFIIWCLIVLLSCCDMGLYLHMFLLSFAYVSPSSSSSHIALIMIDNPSLIKTQ